MSSSDSGKTRDQDEDKNRQGNASHITLPVVLTVGQAVPGTQLFAGVQVQTVQFAARCGLHQCGGTTVYAKFKQYCAWREIVAH